MNTISEPFAEFSLQHERGLAQARMLRDAARRGGRARTAAARRFLAYYAREALPQSREEERVLFPLMLRRGAPLDSATLSLAEHEWLQVLVRRLRASVEQGEVPAAELEAIAGLLTRHVAREERELVSALRTRIGAAPA